jgi:uncharacterized tellurite resistance protein B-like protein
MNKAQKTKLLLKILFGAAWIDGIIQPEERNYLRKKAEEQNLAEDAEIHTLLSELRPVKPTECYQWLKSYLGENPSEQDYQNLVDAIGALIYSDSDVQIQEAQLLAKIQELDPALDVSKNPFDKVLKSIQRLYRSALEQHG